MVNYEIKFTVLADVKDRAMSCTRVDSFVEFIAPQI
jgi:hypothetical protein